MLDVVEDACAGVLKAFCAAGAAKEDWTAIQETLFLLSVPGMRESIKTGMAESTDSCSTELDW